MLGQSKTIIQRLNYLYDEKEVILDVMQKTSEFLMSQTIVLVASFLASHSSTEELQIGRYK